MIRVAGVVLACSMLVFACAGGSSEPDVKAPKLTEGRVTVAKIAGRELPIYTFTAKVEMDDTQIVGQRVTYSITGDLFKRAGGKVDLESPVTLQAQYEPRLFQLRYITDKVKDHDLEKYFDNPEAKVAFYWEVDYKATGGETVHTARSQVYETNRKDIDHAELGTDVKP